jgi:hypothetical protein
MSSKTESKEEKMFNGGSIVDWIIIRDIIELEADRQNCKYQLVHQPGDIVEIQHEEGGNYGREYEI